MGEVGRGGGGGGGGLVKWPGCALPGPTGGADLRRDEAQHALELAEPLRLLLVGLGQRQGGEAEGGGGGNIKEGGLGG